MSGQLDGAPGAPTAGHPLSRFVPQPKWWYGVDQQYVRRLQPLHDVVWQLLQCELMGAKLLQPSLVTVSNHSGDGR
jgi:hypothetical protein